MVIGIYQMLWTTYLKSGVGQLITLSNNEQQQVLYSTKIPIWPNDLIILLGISNSPPHQQNEMCVHFVIGILNELNQKFKYYETAVNTSLTHYFPDHTILVKNRIELYIEKNLHGLRTKIEHQIELTHYDYHTKAIEVEYYRHHPTPYHVRLFLFLNCFV